MHGLRTSGIVPRIVQTPKQCWQSIRFRDIGGATGSADLDIWFADLSAFNDTLKPWHEQIMALDAERLSRIVEPHARHRFLTHRTLLRTVLSSYLGVTPATLSFTNAPQGKPSLVSQPGIQFNQSHSCGRDWDIWALAVSQSGAIGLDIEGRHEIPRAEQLALRVLSATEREALALAAQRSERDRDQAFLWGWTRKEALLKAIGAGFAAGAHRFEVGLMPIASEIDADNRRWWLQSISSPQGHPIGCAADFRHHRLRCFELVP